MIRKILLSSMLSLFCAYCFAQNEYKVLAIGFYNCENFFHPSHDTNKKDEDFTPGGSYHYTDEVYKQKVHNIATVIEQMGTAVTPDGPAIAGLAEIENDKVLTDLVNEPILARRHYKYEWFYTPDERGISTALLYNPKYLKVLNSRPVHVATELLPQKRPTRDILYVCGVLAGDTIHILVNHWPSKFGGEAASEKGRILAATINKQITDSLLQLNPDSKILVLGDFNDNPDSKPLTGVMNVKADKKDAGQVDIFSPWINMSKRGRGTENYQGEWNLIDQILVSGGLLHNNNNKWKYYNAEIFNKDFLVNKTGRFKGTPHRSFTVAHAWDNGYSDHFPVLIYLIEKKSN